MKVTILQSAKKDMEEIFLYASFLGSDFAQRQIDKVLYNISLLEKTPDIGGWAKSLVPVETDRYMVSGRHLVFYKLFPNKVQIVRVMDGRTDWQKVLFKV